MHAFLSFRCAVLDSKRTRVLDYTSEELEEIKNLNPSEWKTIMKEISQKEIEQIQNEYFQAEKKLQENLDYHESLMETKKTELMYRHEDRLEEIEAEAAERIEVLKDNTRKKKDEHKIEMKKKETVHKLQIKKNELLELDKKASVLDSLC